MTPKPSLKIGLLLLAVMVLTGLAAFQWGGWVNRADPSPPAQARAATEGAGRATRVVSVAVANVSEVPNKLLIEVTGSGLALRSATLRPAVAGEVQSVHFKGGQRVRAGHVLLRLDNRNQRLAVDAAANQLQAARQLLARYTTIAGTGAVPASQIDSARTAAAAAEIALDQARAALADRVLLAPFDGVTGLAEVAPGDRVGTDTVVTTLDNRSRLRVAFAVPEEHLARLALGQTLQLNQSAYPGRTFTGHIAQIDSRINAETRTVRIEALVPNGDDVLRAGMSFQVRLQLGGALEQAVPELALQWGRDGPFIWMVRDEAGRKTADQVSVQVLRRVQGQVLVRPVATSAKPIHTGDFVVVEGVQRLQQGVVLNVLAGAQTGPVPSNVAAAFADDAAKTASAASAASAASSASTASAPSGAASRP